jgi:polyhydroxyalkanoate synthesis regulator phasin
MSQKREEPEQTKTPTTRKERVHGLLKKIEQHLNGKEGKASVADFIRLLEYERELADEQQPREMKVTWSEPLETYDTDG